MYDIVSTGALGATYLLSNELCNSLQKNKGAAKLSPLSSDGLGEQSTSKEEPSLRPFRSLANRTISK